MTEAAYGLLRTRERGARVTNVELFFDLVYVFAVTQISHYLLAQPTFVGALRADEGRMGQQVVRDLGHREHVDQVEEQLDVGDPLGAGPRPHQVQRPGLAHAELS